MGKFRCLSKPTKRFFFSFADKVSEKWIEIVSKKYILKFVNKIHKLNNIDTIENLDLINLNNYQFINDYTDNLKLKLYNEKGLGHGKVREYWLRRGPRLLLILTITIVLTIILAIFVTNSNKNELINYIIIGVNMIVFNIYMLYQRLIDSISGSMMRIGHDHYKDWKSNFETTSIKCTSI